MRSALRGIRTHLVDIDDRVPEGTLQLALCRTSARLDASPGVESDARLYCEDCVRRAPAAWRALHQSKP